MKKISKLGILFLIAILILVGIRFFAARDFSRSYAAYEMSAEKQNSAAYTPSVAQNPIRQELSTVLVAVLGSTLSSDERMKRAARGVSLLGEAEIEIDAIGEQGDVVSEKILDLERSTNRFGQLHRTQLRSLIHDAKARLDIIADIRGLSYRANHHTMQIFERILADKGVLSPAYVATLNELLPSVEAQFDTRTNLYADLERLSRQIDVKRAALLTW